MRVSNIQLNPVLRRSVPITAAAARPQRHPNTNPTPSAPTRFKLAPEGVKNANGCTTNGLQEIRADMPTLNDSWDVEKVIQYRRCYNQEQ